MAKQQTPTVASILPEFHGETDDWNVYREILDEFYRANGIAGDDRVPVLISVIGKTTYATLRSLCHPAVPKSMHYEDLCAVLARQFIPEIAIFRHRAQFYRAEQQRGESVKEWYARLKSLSIECKFDEPLLEPLLMDRFVVGLAPGPVQSRLYEERPDQLRSIEKAVDLAVAKESELRQANEGEEMAHEFACLAIGDEMRHGRRRRMHGKHAHRFGGPPKEERYGHRHHGRHGRHHHRHHPSDYESGPEHHRHHRPHPAHPFHPFGHHHQHHHEHPARHFGPPAFGPGPWGGHHRREMSAHHFGPWAMAERMARAGGPVGCPGMMEGFGRPGRPCGKWRKRHHHRRSSSSSSSNSSSSSGSSSSSSSSSSSPSSDSDAPNEQTVEVEKQKKCRKMRRGIGSKHHGDKRHDRKRHGHGRHHHHHKHHHHNQPHGKGGRRHRKQQQEEPIVAVQPEQATPTDPTTDPELIE